jgi:methyl-accepting chemotaxis protein
MKPPSLRRLFLIDRRFQLGMAGFLFAVQLGLLVLFGGLVELFLGSEIDANLYAAQVTYKNMRAMLTPIVFTLGLLNAVLSAVVITVFVVLRTHKIAGPLYRFQTILDAVAARDLGAHASIRQGDQLESLAESLRGLVATVGGDLAKLQTATDALSAALPAGAEGERLRPQVESLRSVLAAWKR